MHSIVNNVVLPLVGVAIIVFCILSFVFRYGQNIRGKTQKIKGFGIDMEVSIIALLIIIGVLLAVIGIYLQIKDFEAEIIKHEEEKKAFSEKIASANSAKEELKLALAQANKIQMNVQLTLDVANWEQMPKLDEVECHYFTNVGGNPEPKKAKVTTGMSRTQFQITFKDVSNETVILKIVLEDRSTGKRWIYEDPILPLSPTYTLVEEK